VVERFDDITVMHDPEGNEFCVEPGPGDPHEASVADGQIRVNERAAMRGPRRSG
jgi:hypothetical protein